MDDKKLVSDFLQNRGESEFRALYRRQTPALYQFALRLCSGSRSVAAEITQDVWVRAIEKLADFRWQSTLKTWLIGIACNCWRERLWQQSKSANLLELKAEEIPGSSSNCPSHEEIIDLEKFINRLPDGSREILLLHDLEGYTHKEISTLLSIEEGTSKSQLSRARVVLRGYLSESEGPKS